MKSVLTIEKELCLPKGTRIIDGDGEKRRFAVYRAVDSDGMDSVSIVLGNKTLIIDESYRLEENQGFDNDEIHTERITRHLGRMLIQIADANFTLPTLPGINDEDETHA